MGISLPLKYCCFFYQGDLEGKNKKLNTSLDFFSYYELYILYAETFCEQKGKKDGIVALFDPC